MSLTKEDLQRVLDKLGSDAQLETVLNTLLSLDRNNRTMQVVKSKMTLIKDYFFAGHKKTEGFFSSTKPNEELIIFVNQLIPQDLEFLFSKDTLISNYFYISIAAYEHNKLMITFILNKDKLEKIKELLL